MELQENLEQKLNPEEEVSTAAECADALENKKEPIENESPETVEIGNEELDPEQAAEEEMSEPIKAEITIESLLDMAREYLAKDPAEYSAEEVRKIQRQFFNLCNSIKSKGEQSDDETTRLNAIEITFNDILNEIRQKRSAWSAEQMAVRAENLARKNAIIEEILSLADDMDNVNRAFPRYKELQDEFNAIGEVDPTVETDVWKRFQDAREKFSDNLKINKELRDYDFKKNLESKQELIDEAKKIIDSEDIIAAYRRLQELHNLWRQIGPVAKELREEIWTSFRDASVEINKRYQAFFEARKAEEAIHESAKEAICQKIEDIKPEELKSYNDWNKATEEVLALQKEWGTLGHAAPKIDRRLFARFRGLCDTFFKAKAEYYKDTREEAARNLAKKTELADRAEALAESTEWRKTADELISMQKEWRTIGSVPKKMSDAVWKRFSTACDTFFERKKQAEAGSRSIEQENLNAKREIIGLLSALLSYEGSSDEAFAQLRGLQARWNEIGHVPFREKDKIYEAYRQACNEVREKFNLRESRRRVDNFKDNLSRLEGDENRLYRERENILRALENRKNDLRTYENNLGFLSSKSKSGESLVRDLQRRIEKLRADINELQEKIEVIDSEIKDKMK